MQNGCLTSNTQRQATEWVFELGAETLQTHVHLQEETAL